MSTYETQNAEFDALRELSKEFDALCRVAPIDDYYPEARHRFEGKLAAFIKAMEANGAFDSRRPSHLSPSRAIAPQSERRPSWLKA